MNKGTAVVGFLLSFLAGMLLMWGIDRGAPAGGVATAENVQNPATWDDSGAAVPVTSNDPMWGSRSAPVTIVLYSDYECPFCSKVEKTFDALKEKYGPQKLRIIWKNNPLPFHKNATPASEAANTVFKLGGNDAFWKFHKVAFENQKALTPENFATWAAEAGVDKAKFMESFNKKEFASKVAEDLAAGKAVGVRGTPASFINGVFLSGAQPQNKFEEIIDKELAEADKLIAAKVAPDKVYTERAKANRGDAPAPTAAEGDKKDAKQPAKEDDKTVWKVPVGNSPAKGPADALVTIVEFSDFECPYCEKVEPTIADVMKAYDGKVRLVWKHRPLPFHRRAGAMSYLSMEAQTQKGEKGFWDAHDALFKARNDIASREKDPTKLYSALEEDLIKVGTQLGLDVEKVKAVVKDADPASPTFEPTDAAKKYQAMIDADSELADDLEASGTPHFFVNGRRLVGAQPIEKFKEVIDEELKKAEDLVAKGTKKADVYAKIMETGKEPPPPESKQIEPAAAGSPWKGSEKAKVEFHIFSDFECPYCKRVEPTLATVEKDFGDKIKIIWRDKPLPMHKNAPLAAEAAREALAQKGNKGFWAFHDALFNAQGQPDALVRTGLDKVAETQGLDMGKFKEALDKNTHKAAVDADAAGADKAGITGTPSFVVTFGKAGDKLDGYFFS
ncbi:MAG: thioredoxin domain-containing protein [Polyangiaceae bacterium]|nr:thioredoxin domain-containing protein [Polyangiaceae bacterium]